MLIMEHNTLFRIIYTLILGIVIAFFFGIGIQAYYEPPKQPEYPMTGFDYRYGEPKLEGEEASRYDEEQRIYQEKLQVYEEERQSYERNVAMILMSLAVVTVAGAFVATNRIGFISDGVLLGGLFTILHSIIRGFAAQDTKFLFMIVTVAVVVVMVLGYRRFMVRPNQKSRKKR